MSDAVIWIMVFVGIWPLLIFAIVMIARLISVANDVRASKGKSLPG